MQRKQIAILATLILFQIIGATAAPAVEQGLTRDELNALLEERDAAIIQLQHTVEYLLVRLETVERSVDPALASTSTPPLSVNETPAKAEGQQDFGKFEIDELAAQRALERTLIQEGAVLLPSWVIEFAPSFSYTLNQVEFPAIVSNDAVATLATDQVERTVSTINLEVRAGLPFDSQLELGLPYRWADAKITTLMGGASVGQSSSRSGSGIGSLRAGLAKTLMRERGWRPDLVGRITWDTGSGDRIDNGVLLGDFESIEGSVNIIKRSDPLVFLGSLRYRTFPEEDDIALGDQFIFSFGTALAVSPGSSLFASISNQFLDETKVGNQQIDGSDLKSVVLNLGASAIVSKSILLNLTTGIGITDDAPDYSIGLSASMRTAALRHIL